MERGKTKVREGVVVGDNDARGQQSWRDGLRWFDDEAGRRFTKTFVQASAALSWR